MDLRWCGNAARATLSAQVFFVELGLISTGIVDTMMVGHVGEGALAVRRSATTTWLVIITMMGLVVRWIL